MARSRIHPASRSTAPSGPDTYRAARQECNTPYRARPDPPAGAPSRRALSLEHLHHLGRRTLRTHYRHVGLDYAAHLVAYLVRGLPRQVGPAHGAVIAPRHGIPHPQARTRIQAVYGQIQHETERAHVAARPRGRRHRQKLDLLGREQRKRQVLILVVYARAHGREPEGSGSSGTRDPTVAPPSTSSVAGRLVILICIFLCVW